MPELYPTQRVLLDYKITRYPMNIIQVREHLHRLIDEVDDLYVLNGLYRNLIADKRQREAYEQEQAKKQTRPGNSRRTE